jgi:tRNA (mo5U34)-methyltransferase
MFSSMTDDEVREQIGTISWYHQIELRPGIVTPGSHHSALGLQQLQFPADCRGARVLDIGTRDGFYAFEMERRGAEVLAVDYVPACESGFEIASSILESKVKYLLADLYDLSPATLGTFDIVLFLGVLYHLHDPLLGIRIVRNLCRDRLFIETYVIDQSFRLSDGSFTTLDDLDPRLRGTPLMQYYPGDSLMGAPTNYWGPNVRCVTDMLSENAFTIVRSEAFGQRAVFECRVIGELQPYPKPHDKRILKPAANRDGTSPSQIDRRV